MHVNVVNDKNIENDCKKVPNLHMVIFVVYIECRKKYGLKDEGNIVSPSTRCIHSPKHNYSSWFDF